MAIPSDLLNVTVFIENEETKRYLFSSGDRIKGDRGDEGGWLSSSGFESPKMVGADANYYNRAYFKIIPQGDHYLLENVETKRYAFSSGDPITSPGAEGGWKESSGLEAPCCVGTDANYYNGALWKVTAPSESRFMFENVRTKRLLFADGTPIQGERGDENGWLASSGFASPDIKSADANYYNRAYWTIVKV